MPITTGRQIAAARALLGLSCDDLAKILTCSDQEILRMERGGIFDDNFEKVADLFELWGVIASDDGDYVAVSVSDAAEDHGRRALNAALGRERMAEAEPATLTRRQAEVAAARMEVLLAFDEFRGNRSARACMDAFIAHWRGLPVSNDARPRLKFGIRTLTRWLAIRARGGSLATHWKGGRKAWCNQFPEVRAALIEEIGTAPVVHASRLVSSLKARFPEHASLFSAHSVNRAIKGLGATGDLPESIRRAVNGRPISG